MRRVPDRNAACRVHAGEKERSAQRWHKERQRRQDWNRMQPRHAIEQPRARREVENRQGDGREGQGACDPREDGQDAGADRKDPLFSEERPAAADAAEGEREDAQPCGQIVASHQQEQQRRASEDRHLDDHPEVPPCPPVALASSQTAGRTSVVTRGGPCPAGSSHSTGPRRPSDRTARQTPAAGRVGLAVEGPVRRSQPSDRCHPDRRPRPWREQRGRAWDECPVRAAAGLPGATRTIQAVRRSAVLTSGGRALIGRCAGGIASERRASARRPQIWPHETTCMTV